MVAARQIFTLALVVQAIGCYHEWDWPAAPRKLVKEDQCIKIINGRFFYVDDCKYWGHVHSSDGQAVLPP